MASQEVFKKILPIVKNMGLFSVKRNFDGLGAV